MIDGRDSVTHLAATGDHRLVVEISVVAAGTLRPSAVVGALLDLPPEAVPRLRVHKVATRFQHAAREPAARAAAP